MNTHCKVCKREIKVAAFKGTPFCSANCKAEVADVSSVGTFMFVTTEEARLLKARRDGKSGKAGSVKMPTLPPLERLY